MIEEKIDYRLVLSDISPTHLVLGYDRLEKALPADELKKIISVLADSCDLRKELARVPLWQEGIKPLNEVIEDPEYCFLHKGYQNGRRSVNFSDCSFGLVIGCIPYTSINIGDYSDAIKESARVLRTKGYHIVDEMHVEKINSNIKRTESALERAKIKSIDVIRSKLGALLKPVTVYSTIHIYNTNEKIPEQTLQNGDLVKSTILVHQKLN